MNAFNSNYEQFQHHLSKDRAGDAVPFLNLCFSSNSFGTLRKLYKASLLPSKSFCSIDPDELECSAAYKAFFITLRHQFAEITRHEKFLGTLSKRQLVQGAANFLEKFNAELKYNENYSVKYTNGDGNFLETERQSMILNYTGKEFQKILEKFYPRATNVDNTDIIWNLDTAEIFHDFFHTNTTMSSLVDFIELHLMFKWSMELSGPKELTIFPPKENRDKALVAEMADILKAKFTFNIYGPIVEKRLLKRYLDSISGKKEMKGPHASPNKKASEIEKENFAKVFFFNSMADQKTETELEMFRFYYCPGMRVPEIKLKDKTVLVLEQVFRITSILAELSKMNIKKIDKEYEEATTHFSKQAPYLSFLSWRLSKCKGDKKKMETLLKQVDSPEEIQKEQQDIIWKSKNKISNEDCLVQQEITPLVKAIYQVTGIAPTVIYKVLDIFTYNSKKATNITHTPFFHFEDKLCWLPNMVAFYSFNENLVEALLAKKMLTLHRLQTEFYEKTVNQLFHFFGYKVVKQEDDKIYSDENGKPLGDFDVLAYKNGHVFHFEIKLTNTRSKYVERYNWLKKVLFKAKKQLEQGKKYIETHPDKIRKILGLKPSSPIEKVHSFILSNTFLFDGEHIGGYLKLSFSELVGTLLNYEEIMLEQEDYLKYKIKEIAKEKSWQLPPSEFINWAKGELAIDFNKEKQRILKYVNAYSEKKWPEKDRCPVKLAFYLNEKRVFAFLEDNITIYKNLPYKIGEYTIITPHMIPQNLYPLTN